MYLRTLPTFGSSSPYFSCEWTATPCSFAKKMTVHFQQSIISSNSTHQPKWIIHEAIYTIHCYRLQYRYTTMAARLSRALLNTQQVVDLLDDGEDADFEMDDYFFPGSDDELEDGVYDNSIKYSY